MLVLNKILTVQKSNMAEMVENHQSKMESCIDTLLSLFILLVV